MYGTLLDTRIVQELLLRHLNIYFNMCWTTEPNVTTLVYEKKLLSSPRIFLKGLDVKTLSPHYTYAIFRKTKNSDFNA